MFDQMRADGKTVVFVSRDLDAVSRFCNRAGLIRGGRLEALGPSTETRRGVPAARARGGLMALRRRFEVRDYEEPVELGEFDAVLLYDALHHALDEGR